MRSEVLSALTVRALIMNWWYMTFSKLAFLPSSIECNITFFFPGCHFMLPAGSYRHFDGANSMYL
jgi:hypothetical protein